MRSYSLYIDGADRPGEGFTYVPHAEAVIRDPRAAFDARRALELNRGGPAADTSMIAGRCAWGGPQDNREAIEAAARASRELREIPLAERKEVGRALYGSLEPRAEEFVEVLIAEGHPRKLAEWEVGGIRAAGERDTLNWLFAQIDQRFQVGERNMVLTRKPDGVVCINPPHNASGANAALGVGALVAGNAIIVKAPKTAPLSVMFLYRDVVIPALESCGFPTGAVNLVSGYSKQILREWVESPLVDDIMFFGDSTAGLKLEGECIARRKKPILELSGNDCVVVWEDADLDAAAHALTESFYGSGQICMVPKQAVLHPAIASELTERLLDLTRAIRPGYPGQEDVILSPVLKMDRFFDFLAEAITGGGELLIGGKRVDVDGEVAIDGVFLEPTIVRVGGLGRARNLRCVSEETFFPLLPLIVPESGSPEKLLGEVMEFVNSNAYGLRNSLWARDPGVIEMFARGVNNGGLLKINESHIDFAPYLGTHGGTGRTGGSYGELHYPFFRTAHLQGVVYGPGTPPLPEAIRPDAAEVVA
jgi:acyl-CoA reductase-like NAD-dependent aldehyde dehydrogenase